MFSPENKGRRIFAHIKNSLGPKQRSLSFYINDGRLRWGEEVDTDADELLQPSQSQGREKLQLEAGKQFLEEILASGRRPSNDVKAKAKEAGISNATLWRAKELLDIKASKERGKRRMVVENLECLENLLISLIYLFSLFLFIYIN